MFKLPVPSALINSPVGDNFDKCKNILNSSLKDYLTINSIKKSETACVIINFTIIDTIKDITVTVQKILIDEYNSKITIVNASSDNQFINNILKNIINNREFIISPNKRKLLAYIKYIL